MKIEVNPVGHDSPAHNIETEDPLDSGTRSARQKDASPGLELPMLKRKSTMKNNFVEPATGRGNEKTEEEQQKYIRGKLDQLISKCNVSCLCIYRTVEC